MSERYVDITHTIKASEANGRRLLHDMKTGARFWEPLEVEVPVVIPELQEPKPKPEVPRKTKKLHHG